MADSQDTSFARVTSLAVHDLRTPLATIFGFARTMQRAVELEPPLSRYVEMIIAASEQMTELLEELGLAARIAGERYEPVLADVDTLELARAAVPDADGTGTTVTTDPPTVQRALAALVDCARKHGGVPSVALHVDGSTLTLYPVNEAAAPVIMGESLKDLGAVVALSAIRALDGSVELDGERLVVRLA
ncbi:MAG: histidine kinase dimerization/phospho-acceptor domain-containing protein [Gaiellaceae bacterium]